MFFCCYLQRISFQKNPNQVKCLKKILTLFIDKKAFSFSLPFHFEEIQDNNPSQILYHKRQRPSPIAQSSTSGKSSLLMFKKIHENH